MTAITFKDIIKGLLFILLMVIAYCVIVKLGKFIFYTVTGSNDLPFIVPLMICITIGYACIAALAKAVESGFSLRSIFRGDGRNPVIK